MALKYSVHIIEDEYSGRKALSILLEKSFSEHIESMTFSRTLAEAQQSLENQPSDIIFLDINLNGRSSFELVHLIPTTSRIVFVTAYSSFMLNAIRARAFDYLVKPIKEQELIDCLNRIKNDKSTPDKSKYLVFRNKGLAARIAQHDILYIEANGPYSVVNTDGKSFVTAKTLKKLSLEMDEDFIRIHKSYLVNKSFVKKYTKDSVILFNDTKLPISRSGLRNIELLYYPEPIYPN